jgi:hypothetical protein
MKTFKTLGIAGGFVAAMLVGGTLINAVFAAGGSTVNPLGSSVDTADKAAYCDTWKAAFAKELGVSVSDLLPAAKAASKATIDAAVANGDLTADRAAALKKAIDAYTGDACRLFGHPFFGFGHGAKAELGVDLLSTAANALGMQPSALIDALRSGKSLKDVASDQGKTYGDVAKAIHDAAKTNLDKLVAAKTITQDREDTFLKNLDAALASGDWPRVGRGLGRHGFGFFHPADGSDNSTSGTSDSST